ncbi:MAG: hypothetical protein HWD92_02470 [Flavobacteriia bacterium]|nr:hypothetical protein [Flavobacteriia bacterium]
MNYLPSFKVWGVCILFLFATSSNLFAQSETRTGADCAIDCLNLPEEEIIRSIVECERCYEWYLLNDDSTSAARVVQVIGEALFFYGSSDSALSYLEVGANLYRRTRNRWLEADIRSSISQLYATNGEYEKALSELKLAVNLVEVPELRDSLHPYYAHMGELLYATLEYEQSLVYYTRALEMFERFSNAFFYKATCYSMTASYLVLGQYSEADSLLKLADRVVVDEPYQQIILLMQKSTEGRFYYDTDQYEKSLNAYLAIADKTDPTFDFGYYVEVNIGLANDYAALGRYDQADSLFVAVIENGRLTANVYFLEDVFRSYAFFLEEIGEFEKSSEVLWQAIEIKDSLLESERLSDLRELHVVDLEQDNFSLMDANKTKQAQIEYYEEYDRLLRFIIIISVIFILILGLLVYYLWSTRRKLAVRETELESNYRKLEEIDRQRVELVKILGHDLRGPIWGLRNFVETLAGGQLVEADEQNLRAHALSSLLEIQDLLEDLTDWAESSGGFLLEFEDIQLRPLLDGMLSTYRLNALAKGIEIYLRIEPDVIVTTDRRALLTIMRNVIQNAIKHTSSGSVTIFSNKGEFTTEVGVMDTGEGMETETIESLKLNGRAKSKEGTDGESGRGIGMQTVLLLCDEIGITLDIESELGAGTTVTLKNLVLSASD